MALDVTFDATHLQRLAVTRMPFGRYAGRLLIDLPEAYLLWLLRTDPPAGRLGRQLREICELKTNGLEAVLKKCGQVEHG